MLKDLQMAFDPEAAGAVAIRVLRFIRVEHTIFTLPMAYAAALLTGGVLDMWKALFIGLAVFGLRTAGMAWNNIADYPIDKLNPRTQERMLVSGKITFRQAFGVFTTGVLIFVTSAALLGTWPLLLALPYLAVVLTYPYAKRIHCLPHLHLGAVYALVPLGASIAMYPEDILEALYNTPWLLLIAAALWVTGFDIIYSKADVEFDKAHGLGSAAACYGRKTADVLAIALLTASATLYVANYLQYSLAPLGLAVTITAAVIEVASAIIGVRGDVKSGFNLNLSVGVLVPTGIFLGFV